jgi:drug/metabolite transporter (DMT)-like permease
MITGLLMLLATGLGWTITGVMLSYTARTGIQAVTLLAPQMLLSLLLASVALPDYSVLAAGQAGRLWPLALLLIGAGIVNAAGILLLQAAMRAGHHGMAWAIGQSALVLPFLVGIVCFGEPLSAGRLLGVAGIIASLLAFGLVREGPPVLVTAVPEHASRRGFLLALAALLTLGSAQALMTLPSHLPALVDTAQLRVPLLYLGHCVVYLGWWGRRPELPHRRILGLAAFCSVVAIISTRLLFLGIDRLAQVQMASVGFPVAVGCCIVGFSLYSAWGLREPFTRRHALGLAAGLFGLLCIVLWGR